MNESGQTKPRRTWTYPWETGQGIFWSVSYLLMVAFAYFTPLDVLDKYPQAKEFTDFMANWNMQIRRVGEISGPANQTNRFVYSVLWCVMPVYWIAMFLPVYSQKKVINYIVQAKSWSNLWFGLFGGLFLFYVLLTLDGDMNSTIGRLLFLSAIGRSMFAPGAVWMLGVTLIVFPYLVWAIATNRIAITGGKHGR